MSEWAASEYKVETAEDGGRKRGSTESRPTNLAARSLHGRGLTSRELSCLFSSIVTSFAEATASQERLMMQSNGAVLNWHALSGVVQKTSNAQRRISNSRDTR